MSKITASQPKRGEVDAERAPYEAPAIIYEGLISTRAGSVTVSEPNSSQPSADPANVFGGSSGPGG